MGCDIHMMVERKKKNRKTWVHETGMEYRPRNYDLFALLAGVRSYDGTQAVFPEAGVAPDASARFKEHCDKYGSDGHSHSFLSCQQYKSVLESYRIKHPSAYPLTEYLDALYQMEDIISEGHQARVCFFFDN